MYSPSSVLQWISLSCFMAFAICTANGSANERIFNGLVTTVEQVPYIVQLRDMANNRAYCGGTLVAPKYVVTAAHCFLNREPEKVLVVGGVNSRRDVGLERIIVNLFIHPEYDVTVVHSDVAVLELNRELSGENIATAPLCQQPLMQGDFVQVSGWGITETGESSDDLRTARLPVTSSEMCAEKFGPFVEKNMFCVAGSGGDAPCPGDSGGPVIYNGQLCGIPAFGFKCGVLDRADAFTDVYAVRSFVEGIVKR